jgi:aminopeptidase-like protein
MPSAIARLLAGFDAAAAGEEMWRFAAELYPVARSLTGDGVRQTLAAVAERIPLQIHEVPTGTQVFDWTVPKEWNVRGAWIAGPGGERVVDFADHNLHLVGYSVPVAARMPLAELRAHLHSLPEQPELIPYRTSYYRETWGFCLPHRQLEALPEGEYEVRIDATLADGSLTYGECLLPGESGREVLVSCHVCHPSLANDNLSGLAVATHLARALAVVPRRYGYRFLFIPGTIGSVTWLARNEEAAARVAHGLVAANLGDAGAFHYKKSRRGDAEIDRAVARVLKDAGGPYEVEEFVPFGYDERQYCSPGFDLPVGSLTRTPWGRYPQYHTSADDLGFLQPESLAGSLAAYLSVADVLEANRRYLNLNPKCEPQLGKRGLYRSVGGGLEGRERELALLWVLNLSDGRHDLLAIAERAGMSFAAVDEAAGALEEAGLLRPLRDEEATWES